MVRALIASYLVERESATVTQAARFFGRNVKTMSARRRGVYAVAFKQGFSMEIETFYDSLGT
jgi:hypothetical protein